MSEPDHEKDEDIAPVKKRGLGRGLDALFSDDEGDYAGAVASDNVPASSGVHTIGVELIQPNASQPRQTFHNDTIDELAESIKQYGVLQPIIVRKKGDSGSYEIVAGERRWRAAQMAQLHEIPVIIMDKGDEETLEIALVENLQRENLNPLDEAEGYNRLAEQYGYSHEKIGTAVGKSRSYVANIVRLLGLSPKVRNYLRDGDLSVGHARALLKAPDAERLADKIVANDLSVRDAEKLASEDKGEAPKPKASKSTKPPKDADTLALEEEMTNMLGMKVQIVTSDDTLSGTIKIQYNSLDALDKLLKRLTFLPEDEDI